MASAVVKEDGSETEDVVSEENISSVSSTLTEKSPDKLQQAGGSCQHSDIGNSLKTYSSTSESVASCMTLDDLPDELMLQIFSYMTIDENVNILQNVCNSWKLLAQHGSLWYDKEYKIRYETSAEEATRFFKAVPELRTVIMEKPVEFSVFQALCENCHRLSTLETYYQQLLSYPEAKYIFAKCKNIHKLRISDMGLLKDERFMEAVLQLKNLRVLQLKQYHNLGHQIQLHGLADACPHLCDIDLGRLCYQVEDIKYLINTKKHILKHLSIKWTSVEGRCVVPLLTACADSLEHLELYHYDVQDSEAAKAFTALGQLHNLRELIFTSLYGKIEDILPLAFKKGGLSKLRFFYLWGTRNLGDEVLTAMADGCPELQELWLQGVSGHTDAAFREFHRFSRLEILLLSYCSCLHGRAFFYISKLPALHNLYITDLKTRKIGPDVEYIMDMTELRCLHFQYCELWLIPFDRFPDRFTNLRELHFVYCDGDQDVLDEMQAQMPELMVEGGLGALFTDSD